MKTLLISQEQVRNLVDMDDAINVIEQVLISKARGLTKTAFKPFLKFDEFGGDIAMMSTYLKDMPIAGLKAITYNSNNRKKDLPTIMATILLVDPETGFPLSFLDGTWVTALRTGAAGAVAARTLARRDSKRVLIIGAGVQGRVQLLGLSRVFSLEEAMIYDIDEEAMSNYVSEMEKLLKLPITPIDSLEETIPDCDLLVTAVPSRQPLIKTDWVSSGTHINCIGADEPGKQELESNLFKNAKIYVDDLSETVRRGAVNVPIKEGVIQEEDISSELGQVLIGGEEGRNENSEITIFDAAGIPPEDIALAWEVYKYAKEKQIGIYTELV